MTDLKKIIMVEGQTIVTNIPSEISTILGSCVAVCLWDKETKLASMNHYLLPGSRQDAAGNLSRGFTSIETIIKSMISRNSKAENLRAKIFGGANSMFPNGGFHIGKKNIEVAKIVLREAGIPITSNNTGGVHGRRIFFNTETGIVRVKLLTLTADCINEEINKGFGV